MMKISSCVGTMIITRRVRVRGTLVPDQLEQVGGPRSGVRFDTDIYYLQFPMYIIQNVLYLGVRV